MSNQPQCPECKGKGCLYINDNNTDGDGSEWATCYVCKGTGTATPERVKEVKDASTKFVAQAAGGSGGALGGLILGSALGGPVGALIGLCYGTWLGTKAGGEVGDKLNGK